MKKNILIFISLTYVFPLWSLSIDGRWNPFFKKEVILALPGNTTVMSGHGPDTMIDVEKKSNPFLS